jgi:hypothetical protein
MGIRVTRVIASLAVLIAVFAAPARAEHGDWLLGAFAFLGGSQAPEGLYYQNLFSYYHASGDGFVDSVPVKCGPKGGACLSANFSGTGSLDLFIDANILTWTSPFKILGANYGLTILLPFAIADANGAATVEPVLSLGQSSMGLRGLSQGGSATKGSIGDMYIEPVNLGWHFKQLDAIISSGFFAPSGPYNSGAKLNIGFGHWTGVFGLGAVAYADPQRTWSLSIYSHYLLYASQIGRNYSLGDVMPFEWAAGKTLDLSNDIIKQVTVGPVGYAQWQVTRNSISATPSRKPGTVFVSELSSTRSQIYSAGPGIEMLTKYGLFSLRWYEEFAAHATPSGSQFMFSLTLPLPEPPGLR